jgi:RNA polymerase sigma-70 factor (ECF subfamily)
LKKTTTNIKKEINESFINHLKNGDRSTLEIFYDQYSSQIYSIILRYVGSIPDAEDLLQDSLIKILESLKNFKFTNEFMFKSWLHKIAINTTLNFIRQQNKFENIDQNTLDSISDYDNYDESLNPYHNLTPQQLYAIIAELPIGYKTVFNLFVIENYSHKEIASELGISENTSKTQLLKARKLLQSKIQKKYSSAIIYEYGKV